jgi:lipid-binding SYLF domain-containing protein
LCSWSIVVKITRSERAEAKNIARKRVSCQVAPRAFRKVETPVLSHVIAVRLPVDSSGADLAPVPLEFYCLLLNHCLPIEQAATSLRGGKMRKKIIFTSVTVLFFACGFTVFDGGSVRAASEGAGLQEEKMKETDQSPPAQQGEIEAKAQLTERAAKVLDEIMETPDQKVPIDLLNRAKCVAVLPATLQAGFLVGAKYGYGLVSCRRQESDEWGPPAFFTLAGGSLGFQIGAKATDLIVLVMNDEGKKKLLNGAVSLGTDIGIAAGPVGRAASAATDASLKASMLSYSRSEGLFAGVNLDGSVLSYDAQATKELYGQPWSAETLLTEKKETPTQLTIFPRTLEKYAPQRRAGGLT